MGEISAFYTMPHPPVMIPEVGRGEEKKIKKTSEACYQIADEIADLKPDTIILITPHGPVFRDAVAISIGEEISGNLEKFRAGGVKLHIKIDKGLTEKIIEYAEDENIPTAEISPKTASQYGIQHELDHGAMVPLYFIHTRYSNYKIVHITYGMLPKIQLYQLGMCIQKAVKDSHTKAVFIASGDLSHKLKDEGPYEYSPYGEKFDKEILSLLGKGDVQGIFNMDETMLEEAGECGLRSYYVMLGAMDGNSIKGHLLSYEGTFGVGYGVMKFSLQENPVDPFVKLARESLTHYVISGKYLSIPSYVTEEMKKNKRGVFVSLKKEGQLRGCIGTIFPVTSSIAEEIIRNAVEAGQYDPRFDPVTEDELHELDFSVDVLTEPQKTSLEELDPKKYGVIVRSGSKSGLLLPDLEGVNTVRQQLEIALQKANIAPGAHCTLEKFEVIRHK